MMDYLIQNASVSATTEQRRIISEAFLSIKPDVLSMCDLVADLTDVQPITIMRTLQT